MRIHHHRSANWTRHGVAIAIVFVLALAGQATAATPELFLRDFDWTGQVQLEIWRVKSPWATSHSNVTCTVPGDFVTIGGSVSTVGFDVSLPSTPALVTESRPILTTNWSAWVGSSMGNPAHELTVHCFGLKLAGVPAATLRANIRVVEKNSGTGVDEVWSLAQLPPGFRLLGGGARANGPGHVLVASWPGLGHTWHGGARSIFPLPSGHVTAYAIGIADTIAGFGQLDIARFTAWSTQRTGNTVASVWEPAPNHYVVAGSGGATLGAGRFLYAVMTQFPIARHPGQTFSSDTLTWVGSRELFAGSGDTGAAVLAIRKKQ
jgi:hypothetical protein